MLAELVTRALDGESEAVARLVEICTPMIVAVARRHVANPADVDDVVQEAWLALAQNMHRLTSPQSVRAWLATVARHSAWRMRCRNRRQVPLGDAGDRASEEDTEAQGIRDVHRAEVHSVLDRALDRLRPDDRRLLMILSMTERPDYRHVSRLVNRPVGSIGPTRQRALARLRQDASIRALGSA